MIFTCKTCLEPRESIYFNKTKTNGKFYFNTKTCKVCKSKSGRVNVRCLETRTLSDSIKMSKEIKDYLQAIKRRKGLITDIDFYLIAHYHIQMFDYKETSYENPIDELLVMYKQLNELLTT